MQPVFRFAPSPNGDLHLGHALSALLNLDLARRTGGRLLIRIEDIDTGRARAGFIERQIEDLEWLGVRADGEIVRQSARLPLYDAALRRLVDRGLTYTSFLSRRQAEAMARERSDWPRDPDGTPLILSTERRLSAEEVAGRIARGDRPATRIDMTAAIATLGAPLDWREADDERLSSFRTVTAEPGRWGDFIVARKDAPAAYALAVVVDDAAQGVSHVVRGRDLFLASEPQRLLQHLLGLPAPVYLHHRLILDDAGRKLAKSRGSTSLRTLRQGGATPADIRRMVGL